MSDCCDLRRSRTACSRFGLTPNSRVSTESGFSGRVLGICPETSKVVVMGDSDTDPDMFLPEQIVSPPTAINRTPVEDGPRASACLWSLPQFSMHVSLSPPQLDAAVIKLCNELSDQIGVDPVGKSKKMIFDDVFAEFDRLCSYHCFTMKSQMPLCIIPSFKMFPLRRSVLVSRLLGP